jgi:hypothetical protein
MLLRLGRIGANDLQHIDHVFSALDVDGEGHIDAQEVVTHEHSAQHNRIKRLQAMTSTKKRRSKHGHGRKQGNNQGKQKKGKHGKQKQKQKQKQTGDF